MKKSLFIILGLCSLLITGCGTENGKDEDKNLSVYEWHYYDETFKHTEDFIAKYDESGKLVKLESIYDAKYPGGQKYDEDYCKINLERLNKKFADYKGVTATCEMRDDSYVWNYSITDEAIEAGALDVENAYVYIDPLVNIHPRVADETKVKETIQKLMDNAKNESAECNDINYAVIDGVKTCW